MSDRQLRELERQWRESGSPEDEENYFRARLRGFDLLDVMRALVRIERCPGHLRSFPGCGEPVSSRHMFELMNYEHPTEPSPDARSDGEQSNANSLSPAATLSVETFTRLLESTREAALDWDLALTNSVAAVQLALQVGPSRAGYYLFVDEVLLYQARRARDLASKLSAVAQYSELFEILERLNNIRDFLLSPSDDNDVGLGCVTAIRGVRDSLSSVQATLDARQSAVTYSLSFCVSCTHQNHDAAGSCAVAHCPCLFSSRTRCIECRHPIHEEVVCAQCSCASSQPAHTGR